MMVIGKILIKEMIMIMISYDMIMKASCSSAAEWPVDRPGVTLGDR